MVERLEVGIVNFLDYPNVVYINQQTIILVTSLLIKIHDHWSTTIEFHAKCLISAAQIVTVCPLASQLYASSKLHGQEK